MWLKCCCNAHPPHSCVSTHTEPHKHVQTGGGNVSCVPVREKRILSALLHHGRILRQSTFSTNSSNSLACSLTAPGQWQQCEGQRHVNSRQQWADWPECTLLSFKASLQPHSHKPQSCIQKQYACVATLKFCQASHTSWEDTQASNIKGGKSQKNLSMNTVEYCTAWQAFEEVWVFFWCWRRSENILWKWAVKHDASVCKRERENITPTSHGALVWISFKLHLEMFKCH